MFHCFLFGKQLQKGDNDDNKFTIKRIKNIYLEEHFKDKTRPYNLYILDEFYGERLAYMEIS